ncbi:MAG: sulfur carrier protein ThiS [Hyphomicrobiaceae bacterium]
MAGVTTATKNMSLVVNGQAKVSRAITLAELILELGYGDAKIATACNGEFVPRTARNSTRLAPGDKIEIVSPRQGG